MSHDLEGRATADIPQRRCHHLSLLSAGAAQAQQAATAAGGHTGAITRFGSAAGGACLAAQRGVTLAQLPHHLGLRRARRQLRPHCEDRAGGPGPVGTCQGKAGAVSAVARQRLPHHQAGLTPTCLCLVFATTMWAAATQLPGGCITWHMTLTIGVILLDKLSILVGRGGALLRGRAVGPEPAQESEGGAAGAADLLGDVDAVAVPPVRLQAARVAALPPAGRSPARVGPEGWVLAMLEQDTGQRLISKT